MNNTTIQVDADMSDDFEQAQVNAQLHKRVDDFMADPATQKLRDFLLDSGDFQKDKVDDYLSGLYTGGNSKMSLDDIRTDAEATVELS